MRACAQAAQASAIRVLKGKAVRTRILAVDDSATIRRAVTLCLEGAGHEVVLAEDGADALRKVEQGLRCDLVVSDVHMPEMDGLELTAALRGHEAFRRTPILILTTESAEATRARGKAAGASAWMLKPFNPDELSSLADHLIQHARAQGAPNAVGREE